MLMKYIEIFHYDNGIPLFPLQISVKVMEFHYSIGLLSFTLQNYVAVTELH